MRNNIIAIVLFIFMILAKSFSQNLSPEDELKLIEKITGLTEHHSFLHTFEGKWKLKGISYASAAQKPLKGKSEIKTILNGHYIEMNLAIGEGDIASHNRILIGYSTETDEYTLYSIDDYYNTPMSAVGQRKNNKIIFNGQSYSLYYNKDIPFRIVIEKVNDNKLSYKYYNTINGQENLLIEIYLYKIKG